MSESGSDFADRDHVIPPPPEAQPSPEFVYLSERADLLRIYDPAWSQNELAFRAWGPRLRFDHHRAPIQAPAEDPERAIWYGAPVEQESGGLEAIEVCLWECFGERRRIDPRCHLGRVSVSQGKQLTLLSLIDVAAARAGTIAQIAASPNANDSQAWSRFFYDHVEIYTKIEGLIYRSAWVGGINIVLYERAIDSLEPHGDVSSLRLSHPSLRYRVARFADEFGFTLAEAHLTV